MSAVVRDTIDTHDREIKYVQYGYRVGVWAHVHVQREEDRRNLVLWNDVSESELTF